ncbi:hypothetical protein [Deinococcus sp. QL22]|uniref:hypothetical protein n=1 Tax=Deinococcus sp. QL22 TaxID=2939437 RepID=UPI002017828F|nr:hypothetical protein [Deinococcus sp. QL22]UQN09074.1 hypothetical protein M1R55_23790 [Deinococcus sp. QL22]
MLIDPLAGRGHDLHDGGVSFEIGFAHRAQFLAGGQAILTTYGDVSPLALFRVIFLQRDQDSEGAVLNGLIENAQDIIYAGEDAEATLNRLAAPCSMAMHPQRLSLPSL